MSEQARLLIADDHAMLRDGLRRSLTSHAFEVIAEAANGQEAVDRALEHKPDVVLMDVTMPVLGGIEATKRLVEKNPDAKVLMLTMHADASLIEDARNAGAFGYLVKDCSIDDISAAITSALNGEKTFLEPAEAEAVEANAEKDSAKGIITAREAEVLQMIADGRNTSEAAKELYVSVKTVKNHLASAYAKLDAHDRTPAVLRAARLGLIKLDQ
jgi:two-component system, NarL family, response regulator DegU